MRTFQNKGVMQSDLVQVVSTLEQHRDWLAKENERLRTRVNRLLKKLKQRPRTGTAESK